MDRESHSGSEEVGEPSALAGLALLRLQSAVVTAMSRIRQRVVQGFAVFSVVSLLLWLATFLYGSFYYSYMPKATFSAPVHYYYRCVCCIRTTHIRTVVTVCFIPSLLLLLLFLCVGQTVNLPPLFCALIQWPTSL